MAPNDLGFFVAVENAGKAWHVETLREIFD
jgi:hypothetical protein